MILMYNSLEYLEETLRSVLSQDPGEAAMQIEVLAVCSPSDPAKLVRRVAGDRVQMWWQPKNPGGQATGTVALRAPGASGLTFRTETIWCALGFTNG